MASTLNPRRLVRNPKALAALGLALVAFLYLRARAASPSVAVSTPVPPGREARGASSDGTASGGSLDGSGYVTADQLAATLTPVAAALEGFQSGLMDLQTLQAQTAAQAQSANDAAAQLAQSYNDATSLGGGGGLAGVISSLSDVVTSLNARAISSSPSPTPIITAAAPPLRVATVTAPANVGQTVVPWASLPASPVPKATQPAAAAAEPFGGVASVKKLANGATLTTYASGRQVEQAPGKSAYVVHK